MSSAAPPVPPPAATARTSFGDRAFLWLSQGAGLLVLVVAAALVGVLTHQAWPALERAREFELLTSWNWSPPRGAGTDEPEKPVYGALVFVYGTVATSLIAMLVAVPLGVGAAAYLSEIASPRVRRISSFLLELLAAIPSVIFGFWALEFLARRSLAPFYTRLGYPNQSGEGILAAGLVLAVMILPYITALSFDVCQAVPRSQREGSLALGATRWHTIWKVVLPYARPGIIAACFLALGRAAGETMAVTMVIGSNQYPPKFHLDDRGDSIPSLIAGQLPEASGDLRAVLIALGLLLLGITLVMNVSARLLIRWASKPRVRRGRGIAVEEGAAARSSAAPQGQAVRARRRAALTNRIMTLTLWACQWLTVVPLFLILGYITDRGARHVHTTFFTNLPIVEIRFNLTDQAFEALRTEHLPEPVLAKLDPLKDRELPRIDFQREVTKLLSADEKDKFLDPILKRAKFDKPKGFYNGLVGSATLVGLASAAAVPLGLLAAIFLSEYRRHWLAGPVRFVAELLAGVPSIVVGVFGYSILVYSFWLTPGEKGWGFSAWAGAFALAVMMLPIMIRAAEEAMRLVPNSLREASYALGATRRQTVMRVVIPAALPAIITGVLLAVGRVAGETAPLLLTAGGANYVAESLSDPTPALPLEVYDFAKRPDRAEKELAWAGAFVLVVVVLCLNVGTRLIAGKRVVAVQGD